MNSGMLEVLLVEGYYTFGLMLVHLTLHSILFDDNVKHNEAYFNAKTMTEY